MRPGRPSRAERHPDRCRPRATDGSARRASHWRWHRSQLPAAPGELRLPAAPGELRLLAAAEEPAGRSHRAAPDLPALCGSFAGPRTRRTPAGAARAAGSSSAARLASAAGREGDKAPGAATAPHQDSGTDHSRRTPPARVALRLSTHSSLDIDRSDLDLEREVAAPPGTRKRPAEFPRPTSRRTPPWSIRRRAAGSCPVAAPSRRSLRSMNERQRAVRSPRSHA